LFKIGEDNLLRRCVAEDEAKKIIRKGHNSSYGGNFNGGKTTAKILQPSFFWPSLFKYTHEFMTNFKEQEASLEDSRCYYKTFKKLKSLIIGELISQDH